MYEKFFCFFLKISFFLSMSGASIPKESCIGCQQIGRNDFFSFRRVSTEVPMLTVDIVSTSLPTESHRVSLRVHP